MVWVEGRGAVWGLTYGLGASGTCLFGGAAHPEAYIKNKIKRSVIRRFIQSLFE